MRLSAVDRLIDFVAPCPWTATVGASYSALRPREAARSPLYTVEERRRRDETAWTLVQGILAPIQFVVFAVSLTLILHYLMTGSGFGIAAASVLVKTLTLYAIMVTGSIWEKKVFNVYLFAPAFFWEDMVSMLVLALHTLYLIKFATGTGSERQLMALAIVAYTSYVINAAQYILKFRAARLQAPARTGFGLADGGAI